jgi:hypothetical protein
VWGDRYVGGAFIHTTNKRGVVLVGDFGTGRCYYMSSQVRSDSRTAELHIFDPEQLAEVAAGRRAADSLVPSVMIPLPETDGSSQYFGTYDETGKRLYIMAAGSDPEISKLYVYSVNA